MENLDLSGIWRDIGLDRDYRSLDLSGLDIDLQGWGSEDPIFRSAFEDVRPSIVIEVGTWKGASLLHMAGLAAELGLDTQFIAVDTWLGSHDVVWLDDDLRASLRLQAGYPNMFPQFIKNIVAADVADRIYPLPMTSTGAFHLLTQLGIAADLIYIDAGHEYEEVSVDISHYWSLIKPSGVLIGDDYSRAWPGVIAAVNEFASTQGLPVWTKPGKYRFDKLA